MPKIICRGAKNEGFCADAVTTGMQIGGKKMPRYIDAENIRLPKGFFEKVNNVPKFYEWLDEQPTADVAEVKHGKWLVIDNDEDELWKGGGHYECSACGYGFSFGGFFEMNTLPYCPHCGAKMEVPDEEPT